MKNEKIPSKPRTTVRKAVAKAIKKTDKENGVLVQKNTADVQELIRLKAYELYVERGYQNGNDMEDWLTAERLVLKKAS